MKQSYLFSLQLLLFGAFMLLSQVNTYSQESPDPLDTNLKQEQPLILPNETPTKSQQVKEVRKKVRKLGFEAVFNSHLIDAQTLVDTIQDLSNSILTLTNDPQLKLAFDNLVEVAKQKPPKGEKGFWVWFDWIKGLLLAIGVIVGLLLPHIRKLKRNKS